VIGDVEAFIAYVESGQALHDWQKRRADALQEIERFLKSPHCAWQHPGNDRGNTASSAGGTPIPV
jgi:hypothetical protein